MVTLVILCYLLSHGIPQFSSISTIFNVFLTMRNTTPVKLIFVYYIILYSFIIYRYKKAKTVPVQKN